MTSDLTNALATDTGVLVLGITGRTGGRHARLMRAYGTPIAGGTTNRTDVAEVDGIPVFRSVAEAAKATHARTAIAFVPAVGILQIVDEAARAGIRMLVTVAEGMPVRDASLALEISKRSGMIWIGPSTPGFAVPGKTKVGFLPDICLDPGPLGIIAKSGTLSYEVCHRLKNAGFGQSAWIGVGGEMIKGLRFADTVGHFQQDPATKALVMIGEIGGTEEEEFARMLVSSGFSKPCFALIAGSAAPEGKIMGHAAALAHGKHGTFEAKAEALSEAGVRVMTTLSDLVEAVASELIKEIGASR